MDFTLTQKYLTGQAAFHVGHTEDLWHGRILKAGIIHVISMSYWCSEELFWVKTGKDLRWIPLNIQAISVKIYYQSSPHYTLIF